MRAIPHLITLFRLLSSPFIAWLLVKARFEAALGLVLAAGLSDWLDGFAARRLKASGGPLGIILDPLADKVLLVTLFVTLALIGLIPLWMFWLAIGRDVVIVVGAWLVRLLRGIRKFLPTTLGKVSTFFQLTLVLTALLHAAFVWQPFLWLKDAALALSALFTGLSGLDYVRKGVEMARQPRQFADSS